MRGALELNMEILLQIFIAIIVLAGLYFIFPRSSCDNLAMLSAQEVKAAVECAAGTGKEGCKSEAIIKLCQEDKWNIVGVPGVGGVVESGEKVALNYYGLTIPQYLLYYQKFPTQQVEKGWSESYPFERSTIGQRFWDLRPTLTQFKQFYRTKYLQEGCTSGKGFCMNIRGREEVVNINADEITDIRLGRPATVFTEPDPKFHLVAPCFARVRFQKSGTDIVGSVQKLNAGYSSNYCYADEGSLNNLAAIYAGEGACKIGMIALDVLSLGTKKAAEIAAKKAAKESIKIIARETSKQVFRKAIEQGLKKSGKVLAREKIEDQAEIYAKRHAFDLAEKESGKIAKDAVKNIPKITKGKKWREVAKTSSEYGGRDGEALGKRTDLIDVVAIEDAAIKAGASADDAKLIAKEAVKDINPVSLGNQGVEVLSSGVVNSLSGKKFWGDVAWRVAAKKFAGYQGITAKDVNGFFGTLPCVDLGDPCRGAAACGEALMWPGLPFDELTEEKMKSIKSPQTASEIFTQCCAKLNYGAEKDSDNISCDEPFELVDLMKTELGVSREKILNLTAVADYIGIKKTGIANSCAVFKSSGFKSCEISDEVLAIGYGTACMGFETNTFSFDTGTSAQAISIFVRTLEDGCAENLKTEISEDGSSFSEMDSRQLKAYPEENYFTIKFDEGKAISKIRLSAPVCKIDFSTVNLDANAESAVEASAGGRYDIKANIYSFFIAPENFKTTSRELCEKTVSSCTAIQKFEPTIGDWIKYIKSEGRVDFEISSEDKFGVLADKNTQMVFPKGE